MISPYMPTLTSRILGQLNLPEDTAQLSDELIKGTAAPQVSRSPVYEGKRCSFWCLFVIFVAILWFVSSQPYAAGYVVNRVVCRRA
jgi:hypothetical protein